MADDIEQGKACAVLAYLLVGIIWYFADEKMRKNEFAKFHTKQALVLLIIGVILSIVSSILIIIPFIGWIILTLVQLAMLVLWIFGLVYAATGQTKEVPIVGQFGNKFTF